MKAYKIKVANEAESKEVQELLFESGYEWSIYGRKIAHTGVSFLFAKDANISMSNEAFIFLESSAHQEITLPKLRDLVVLHRNDVSDATHITNMSAVEFGVKREYYIGESVFLFHYGKWAKSPYISLENYKEKLLPITQEQSQMTWQDALRAVADVKEVEFYNEVEKKWYKTAHLSIDEIINAKCDFRLAPQRKELNGKFTKEELLKIAGEMG